MTASPMPVNVTCSRAFSSRSVSSARFRSEISLAIFEAPTMLPSSSLMGETVSEMGKSRPSFARRTVSKCSTRSPLLDAGQDGRHFISSIRWCEHGNRVSHGLGGQSNRTVARLPSSNWL